MYLSIAKIPHRSLRIWTLLKSWTIFAVPSIYTLRGNICQCWTDRICPRLGGWLFISWIGKRKREIWGLLASRLGRERGIEFDIDIAVCASCGLNTPNFELLVTYLKKDIIFLQTNKATILWLDGTFLRGRVCCVLKKEIAISIIAFPPKDQIHTAKTVS